MLFCSYGCELVLGSKQADPGCANKTLLILPEGKGSGRLAGTGLVRLWFCDVQTTFQKNTKREKNLPKNFHEACLLNVVPSRILSLSSVSATSLLT